MAQRDEVLIGALLAIPYAALVRRVHAGYVAAGFDDIRPAHTPVFQHLAPEGSRVTELAERAGMTKQAMGYLIAYLEEHGYVERAPDPRDGRAQVVRRTERGWAINRTARRVVQEVQDEWARRLGDERMRELRTLLAALVEVVDRDAPARVAAISARPKL